MKELSGTGFDEETGKGVWLVDFWAPWCMPCKMLAPVLEKISETMGDKLKVGKCNVDENAAVAARFNVRSVPTTVILRDGVEVALTKRISKHLGLG